MRRQPKCPICGAFLRPHGDVESMDREIVGGRDVRAGPITFSWRCARCGSELWATTDAPKIKVGFSSRGAGLATASVRVTGEGSE